MSIKYGDAYIFLTLELRYVWDVNLPLELFSSLAQWHIFCHILWVKNGSGKTREMRTWGQQWKKKKWYIYFCLLHKCLVGWGKICLLVCENHSLIILFMAKNHKQVEQSYVLRAGMIAMCTFLFVLYNVNMIISKLTFWDMVGFWMKV